MKYLLIGGVADGEWADTNGSPDWSQVGQGKMDFTPYPNMHGRFDDKLPYSRYRRVPFRAGGSETFVYMAEENLKGIKSSDDVSELTLHALIAGYGKRSYERGEEKPPQRRPGMRPAEWSDLEQFAPDPDEIDRMLAKEEQRRAERLGKPRMMSMDLGKRMQYDEQYMRIRTDFSDAEKLALLSLLKDIPEAVRELSLIVGPKMFDALMNELISTPGAEKLGIDKRPTPGGPPYTPKKNDDHNKRIRK